jgi:hypothetical protein
MIAFFLRECSPGLRVSLLAASASLLSIPERTQKKLLKAGAILWKCSIRLLFVVWLNDRKARAFVYLHDGEAKSGWYNRDSTGLAERGKVRCVQLRAMQRRIVI